MGTVSCERRDDLWPVTIERAAVRNAVDRPTAEGLSRAFTEFDADATLKVAVLTGAGGHFCAGADLKAIASGNGYRARGEGDGPMGNGRRGRCDHDARRAFLGVAAPRR